MYRDRFYPRRTVDEIASTAVTIDDILDAVVGIRPAGHLLEIADKLGPANVINELTGLPKPSEVVDDVLERLYQGTTGAIRGELVSLRRRW